MRQTHDRDPKKNKSAQTSCAKNTERLVKREVAPRCPEGPGAHSGNAGLAKGGAPRGGRGPAGGRTSLRFVLLRLALVVEAHGAPVHAVGLHAVLAAEAAGVVCGDRAAAVRGRARPPPWGSGRGAAAQRPRAHVTTRRSRPRSHTSDAGPRTPGVTSLSIIRGRGRGAAVPLGKATAWEGHRRDSSVEESCAAKTFPETAPPSRARGQLRARDPSARPPQPNDTHETEGRGCKTPRVLRGGDALAFL